MRRGMTVEITIWRCKANFAAVALLIFILSLLFSVRQHAQTEKQAISFDLLVKNGTIVTMDGEHRNFGGGVVAVREDAIAFVGCTGPRERCYHQADDRCTRKARPAGVCEWPYACARDLAPRYA